uniref:26S proteasome non-ATPase regulatory subunit 1/RPN2 N-terminal domain-containing protein n=1 Tax=Panagrolaimus superbus TaxID=310955 RepID=A0A914YFL8_9BILA
MRSLGNATTDPREKELIIKTFDDWGVLTSTWYEVADYLSTIEKLSNDSSFSERHRAALLSSKVVYCLGDYAGALQLALGAEDLFSLSPRPAHPEYGQQDELVLCQ